jgi:hypothetical protein
VTSVSSASQRWLFALCSLSLLLSAASAAATPSIAERETARSLMEEGDHLIAQGDAHSALAKYEAAHAIMHVPTTGLDLARTHEKLGQLVEARAVAIEVLNIPPTPNEPAVFTEAREAAGKLAESLKDRVPTITVNVTPANGEHTVSIDGARLPKEARAIAFRTNPGTHTVLVERPGSPAQQRSLTLVEGQAATIPFTFAASAVAAAAPPPPAASAITRDRPVSDEDPASAGRIRGIIGLSVGGVALLAGAATGVISLVQVNDLKARCPNDRCSPADRDQLQTAITLGNVSNVALPIGVLGLAWGLYELLTLPSTPSTPRAAALLRFELTATGVALHGTL